jgi:outer membrane protein
LKLGQNFAIDSPREQIYIAKVNRDMSDVQLRATIMNTVANSQTAYGEYVYATQSVAVARDSLKIASQLVADNTTRVEVGTMAPLDVLTARSQEATAQQALVAAIAVQRTDEIALKQLICTGTDDANWNASIEAVDQPDFNPQPIDLEAALRRALSERTDLQLAKQTVQENDITLRYMRDQLKPQANFVVSYAATGIGGPALERGTSTLGSPITETLPGGISDAFSSLFARDYPTWTAGVNFSYPILTNSAQAQLARARVQLNQVNAQLKQTELQVATDVTNAYVTIQNNVEAAQAAQVGVDLAQKELDAEQAKFDVGMSTNYNVVLAQQTLSTARQSLLRAVANYREALVTLDRVQKTTLSGANIQIVGH